MNVLIAADILKKEGKAVFCDDKVANIGKEKYERDYLPCSIGAHRRRSMREDKEKLEVQLVYLQNLFLLKIPKV